MKIKLLFLSFTGIAGAINAQQVIPTQSFDQGSKHPNKEITTSKGQQMYKANRVTYFEESFDNGLAGDPGNGAWTTQVEPGGNPAVNWEVTSVGHANDAGSTFIIPALQTSTPTSWMMVDSDSDGTSGSDENCSLISPVIDLSSAVPNLKLEWEQFFAEWENDTLYVGVSTDGGTTWTEWDINQGVGRNGRPNPEVPFINISNEVTANPSNVQVRFRWKANWDYGWQVDNVAISELPQNDLKVSRVFHSDLSNDEQMYSMVPEDQVTPLNIGAEVENIGYDDQTNVTIDWEILDGTSTVVASGSSSNSLVNLNSGEKDSIWINTGYTPTAIDNYQIICTVVYPNTDDDPSNDSNSFDHYEVTEYIYAVDYGTQEAAFYNFANNNQGEVSIGNLFDFNNAATISAVWVGLDDNDDIAGNLFYVEVYIFDQGTGDFNFMSDAQQILELDDVGELIKLNLTQPVSAQAGDEFLVVAGHYGGNPGVGVQLAGKVQEGFVQGFDETSQRVSLLDPSAPVVRIDLQDYTSVDELTSKENIIAFPNPATNELNISFRGVDNQNVTLNLKDISGKNILKENVNVSNGSIHKMNIDHLSDGIYLIEIHTQNQTYIEKIIKE